MASKLTSGKVQPSQPGKEEKADKNKLVVTLKQDQLAREYEKAIDTASALLSHDPTLFDNGKAMTIYLASTKSNNSEGIMSLLHNSKVWLSAIKAGKDFAMADRIYDGGQRMFWEAWKAKGGIIAHDFGNKANMTSISNFQKQWTALEKRNIFLQNEMGKGGEVKYTLKL